MNDSNRSKSGSKVYDTALYLRLSKEDGDRDESDSIIHQESLGINYIEQRSEEFSLCETYRDDGYSGTNFNRPQFKRLIKDVDKGRINCIIVKDLSRFGRDYIDVGWYLEKVFPQKGIRFIAINDNIDSHRKEYDMLMPIKNIFNEQYARDISKKVTSAYHTLQQQGCFIGSYASYGYKRSPVDKHKLIIDEYPAGIVRRIFRMFIEGESRRRIAMTLNAESIPSPSAYKKSMYARYVNGRTLNEKYAWSYNTVYDILQKEVYIGHMVQGIHRSDGLRGKSKKTAPEERVRVEHTHEPIISLEVWDMAQKIIRQVSAQPRTSPQKVSPLAGVVRCADCGKSMVRYYGYSRKNEEKVYYYSCASYKRYGAAVCTKHAIRCDILEAILLEDMNQQLQKVKELKQIVENQRTELLSSRKNTNSEADIAKTNIDINKIEGKIKDLYDDYKEGLLNKAEMISYKEEYKKEKVMLENKITLLIKENKEDKGILTPPVIEKLLKYQKFTNLDREMVMLFLESISVYEDKQIDITYSFNDEVDLLLQSEYIF